jgi:Protein of unknown function (DUF1592)/Protein of unknown function (DUF1588)/Protein of unknown function (DUF1587)/Protein of unknown function (DUF1585)/Protein of unknown function (DUF1595)
MLRTAATALLLVLSALAVRAATPDPTELDLERSFVETVRPFLVNYCISCHSGEKPMAQFDLRQYSNLAAVVQDHRHWSLVLEKLGAKQMPPQQAQQPAPEARQTVIAWIDAVLKNEARKNAGDPGLVLARRLSNAEYNYTIRDLTGVDIKPTREFPVDAANPAGFDNSGESLAMSPALLNKYLQAAREVANHLVLKPNGLAFASHPMLVETDRDKYCVSQIVNFYQGQATDFSDYFQTAWRFKHRAALGKPKATLADFATESQVSPKYLATVWHTLEGTTEDVGPTAKLQAMWRELPAPKSTQPEFARDGCDRMRDFVMQLRRKLEPRFPGITVKGMRATSQPFLMWKNRQYATHRMDYDRDALQVEGKARIVQIDLAPKNKGAAENNVADEEAAERARNRLPNDPDLRVPAGQRARYEAAFSRFCAVFPDAFYVSERGRNYLDPTKDKGRLLSAGFHNLMGYFRDDLPLYELILDEKGQKELDALWQELDFIASGNIRTYVQFYFNEAGEAHGRGPESGALRPADKEVTSEVMIQQVKDSYLAKAGASSNETVIQAIEDHFQSVNAGIRWVERARIEAEPRHLEALQQLAARAYRRPLAQGEPTDLLAFYRSLRDKSGLDHEEALRDSVVSILMSPDFCYRIDLVDTNAAPEPKVSKHLSQRTKPTPTGAMRHTRATSVPSGALPLSDFALASRLSYFLWSSMPDEELLARAAAGELRKPEVLAAQVRRMLKDKRARGLATEFAGNWLDFRRFEELNTVDRERFTSFTNELRQAMFEEPIEFFADVAHNDRSVLDFLYANHTFVNPVLAEHYGMPGGRVRSDEWVRVEDATRYGRGGLLPMSVFLTKNAPGLRTSPVKRGYWVVKRVLGEEIPPPPAVVPELPRDEAKLDLPLREVLAKHREDASCASCHARFDSFGLAFEGYGPVGERRTKDLAGRLVDTQATFPGGSQGSGFDGLRSYIRTHRESDFIDNLCRKMLVYALGRSLLLSDEPTIEATRKKLAANGYRLSSLVESIVTSPQFLTKRGQDAVAGKAELRRSPALRGS